MSIGAELRQAREQAGLSAEQVSERTKVQLYKIEALENDDFANLPDGIYLDGIVRAYAIEVGIEPEPLIARVRQQRGPSSDWDAEVAELGALLKKGDVPRDHQRPLDVEHTTVIPPPVQGPGKGGRFSSAAEVWRGNRLVPVLLLLAITGWGAYLYELGRSRDGDLRTEDAPTAPDTSVAQERPAAPTTTGPPQSAARGTVAEKPSARPSQVEPTTRARGSNARSGAPSRSDSTGTAGAPPSSPSPESPSGAAPAKPRVPPPSDTPAAAPPARDVSGSWNMSTRVEKTSLEAFEGLRLGYAIQLKQDGDRVTGSGRKVTENGKAIDARAQTSISLSGTISGDRLTLSFTEKGSARPSEGKLVLLADESGELRGRFSSTAAQSSGTVEASRNGNGKPINGKPMNGKPIGSRRR